MLYSDFHGLRLSKLGFGMMRLPTTPDGSIDEAALETMIDAAIRSGVNYFDTAYPYHGGKSELVTGRLLKKYPRDSFYLANKYPGHQYADVYDPAAIFEDQLQKCQVDHFDFYLLHNVCESSIDVYRDPRWKIVDYFVEQKKLGRIRHLGFSAHAEVPTLSSFLDEYSDVMEFCQIQLNYLDWTLQHADQKCALLARYGIPIWVMEPVRGGRLAALTPEQTQTLKSLRPDESIASWAFRWLHRLPNIAVILSGMSNMDQVLDNLRTFSTDAPQTDAEAEVLAGISAQMLDLIPCTACRYCCDGCPQGLDIPMLLSSLNDARFAPNFTTGMRMESLPEDKLPSACIACGACTRFCPQHIDIPSLMKEYAALRSRLPNWKAICQERAQAAKALKS